VTGTAVKAPPTPNLATATTVDAPSQHLTRIATWLRRPVIAGVVLLVIYAALSFALNNPQGTLGTDTGGKLATLHMMERNGGLDPDIGYWAADADPTGVLHPLHYTYPMGDKWVNVTTVPMLYAAYPLYLVGGDRAVLFLPMLGAVLCAFAARALARRTGGGDGWVAFWVIGLASPVAIYALDFWEHTIGLGLMLWGVVLLLDVLERRAGWRGALGAGALFGAAATMRTEALVYLVVATGLVCIVALARERRLGRPIRIGLLSLAGAAVPLVVNRLVEQWTIGTDVRGTRAVGTASAAGASPSGRVREALTTAVGTGFSGLTKTNEIVVGAVAVACVAGGAWCLASRDRRRTALGAVLFAFGTVVYLARFSQGWGFVPGMLVASPLAAVGLCLAWSRPQLRLPAAIACLALPIAWYAQYQGGADPQWGGRYILTSGALLAIAGCVALQGRGRALVAVVTLAGITTLAGVAWLSVRSNTVADGMATIVARHDEMLISRQPHMLREAGAFYDGHDKWLSATDDAQLRDAVAIARDAGIHEFALIGGSDQAAPASIGGYRRGGRELVAFIRPDVKLSVTTYRTE
jgi:hypothetical protein